MKICDFGFKKPENSHPNLYLGSLLDAIMAGYTWKTNEKIPNKQSLQLIGGFNPFETY